MSALTDRIAEVLRRELAGHLDYKGGDDYAAHVAAAVEAELMSWDFLMALLNEHYPEDVFPTMEDRADRDPGPRIVSLIRYLDAARRSEVTG